MLSLITHIYICRRVEIISNCIFLPLVIIKFTVTKWNWSTKHEDSVLFTYIFGEDVGGKFIVKKVSFSRSFGIQENEHINKFLKRKAFSIGDSMTDI